MDIGSLIRQAREQAELSQAALANRCGTTQSAISAYERNRRIPTGGTLGRLIEAAGATLVIERGARRPSAVLAQRRQLVTERITRSGGVRTRIFGSVGRGDDKPGSDIDLLVDFDREPSLFEIAGLQADLEEILGCHVDLGTDKSLRRGIRGRVLSEARAL